ncbi:hypothetical protein [Ekhidna sp.]
MKSILVFTALVMLAVIDARSQSFEFMGGTERIFVDVQWLETFDDERKWSLFSRTRATAEDRENTNLFTGAYLNYTTTSGFGGTILGRISSLGAGSDVGIHFFKATKEWMVYALISTELNAERAYSWFSIVRFTPELNEKWRLYNSLELFSNFNKNGHVVSVQRIRAGLKNQNYQFGLAINLSGLGPEYDPTDANPGIFVRKEF